MKTKQITITIKYDYLIFDGENYDEIKEFVQTYKLYGNECIDKSFHIRPIDIPNLDETELLKWWQSTGDMLMNAEGAILYTRNIGNLPLWKKDELIMIEFQCGHDVRRKWLKKGDAIIYYNGRHYILSNASTEGIENFIDTLFNKHIIEKSFI